MLELHQIGVNPFLVDGPKRVHGNLEGDPLVQLRDKKTLHLQIRFKAAARFPVGVGNVISVHGAFPR